MPSPDGLPATSEQLHRTVAFPGPAGTLEGLLWSVPPEQRARIPLAAVVCHPHPLFGGTMHNKVVYQAAKRLHRFAMPVLRFNFRGVGQSAGAHDRGQGEVEDAAAAIAFMAREFPGVPLLLAGFSFGSWVGLRAGCADARVVELIGMGLPVASLDQRNFSYLQECVKPKLLVSGEWDTFSPPPQLAQFVEELPAAAREATRLAVVAGADHFFTGHLPELDRVIGQWLVERRPGLAAVE